MTKYFLLILNHCIDFILKSIGISIWNELLRYQIAQNTWLLARTYMYLQNAIQHVTVRFEIMTLLHAPFTSIYNNIHYICILFPLSVLFRYPPRLGYCSWSPSMAFCTSVTWRAVCVCVLPGYLAALCSAQPWTPQRKESWELPAGGR